MLITISLDLIYNCILNQTLEWDEINHFALKFVRQRQFKSFFSSFFFIFFFTFLLILRSVYACDHTGRCGSWWYELIYKYIDNQVYSKNKFLSYRQRLAGWSKKQCLATINVVQYSITVAFWAISSRLRLACLLISILGRGRLRFPFSRNRN